MMQLRARLELDWWPVGQGLFASGRLTSQTGGDFTWIYDCGTTSAREVLDDAVSDYNALYSGPSVDMVVLSHFDADHISGIGALLATKSIKMLVLPYLPFWQRIMIAFAQGIATTDLLFSFFVDPVSYLAGIADGRIEQIILVPSAGPDDRAPEDVDASDPDGPIDAPKVEEGSVPGEAKGDLNGHTGSYGRMRYLRRGGRIVFGGLWEFVPYNDAQLSTHATPAFKKRAELFARNFVARPSRRTVALRLLQRLYDRTFGATGFARNVISLFLYSGPLGTRLTLCASIPSKRMLFNSRRDNFAQLHTGDGYLDTSARLQALQRFYSPGRRLARAGIFQVMHHGARGNWHAGVAAALKPAVSVFSSDPAHKKLGHPHAEVVRDFRLWCPVQVDRSQGFHFKGLLIG